MKWNLPILFFLTSALVAFAQSPQMTVREADGTEKPLRIEQADISVQMLGDVAEMVFELTFCNDGPRAVEGEFALTLPEGATDSDYALEVNGAMRAAVAVEKERARTAYETVKRRLIDPGIVEREAGNIYRTKVYPVPANGTKKLCISYIETLRAGGEGLIYSLPLEFPDPIDRFSCLLVGEAFRVTDGAGMAFTDDGSHGLRTDKASFRPSGKLKLFLKAPVNNWMMIDDGPKPAFVLSAFMPGSLLPRPRPAPETMMLVWDASGSGRGRDHAKEFALLDAWFTQLGDTRVKLCLLRDQLESVGDFDVRDGAWQELKQALEQVGYDGATDFSQLTVASGQADVMLLVSDGISTLGSKQPAVEVPWFFLHPDSIPAGNPLGRLAIASGGDDISLSKKSTTAALDKLSLAMPRLIAVTGVDVTDVVIEATPGQRLRVLGTLKESREGTLDLRYGCGNEVVTTRTLSYQPGGNANGMVRRLYAQRVLADIERQFSPDRKAIIAHCKRHGLVSDFTSLIVLERLEDYAEHGIRPPEPELQSPYDELVAKFNKRKSERYDGMERAWRKKLAWHAKRFPGYEARILPRLRQVEIWKQAVEKQFTPAQRDARAFGVIAGWFDQGMELVDRIPKIRTAEEYDNWRKGIDDLHAQGQQLATTPLHEPPAGQELAVSVRGLVAKPGVITSKRPLTLREAVTMAGKHRMGSLDHVALYRNAGKVVYNTLSERFQDVPLFPADMVVIGQRILPDHSWDPFCESGPPPDPRNEAPIRDETDVWTHQTTAVGGGGRGAQASGNGGIRVIQQEVDSMELPDPAVFENELTAGKNPEAVYQNHRGEGELSSKFYIEAARVLFSQNHDALATRVLSNLVEMRPGDVSALRGYAFWLAEFGQVDLAEKVLVGISGDSRIELLVDMDLASLRSIRGKLEEAVYGFSESFSMNDLAEFSAGELAAIAMTDFNDLNWRSGLREVLGAMNLFGDPDDSLQASDIRVVLTSADDAAALRFETIEPGGFRCSTAASPSPTGGRVAGSRGVREFMVRHAVPGTYEIRCATDSPTTVRAVIHTNWGRSNETTRVVTLMLSSDKLIRIAELEFEFRAAE